MEGWVQGWEVTQGESDTSNGQMAEVNEKVATMSKNVQSPSRARSSADVGAAAGSEEVQSRLERVEDDVSALIGVRDSSKAAWAEVLIPKPQPQP